MILLNTRGIAVFTGLSPVPLNVDFSMRQTVNELCFIKINPRNMCSRLKKKKIAENVSTCVFLSLRRRPPVNKHMLS